MQTEVQQHRMSVQYGNATQLQCVLNGPLLSSVMFYGVSNYDRLDIISTLWKNIFVSKMDSFNVDSFLTSNFVSSETFPLPPFLFNVLFMNKCVLK